MRVKVQNEENALQFPPAHKIPAVLKVLINKNKELRATIAAKEAADSVLVDMLAEQHEKIKTLQALTSADEDVKNARISDLEATNAVLAERVAELEAILNKIAG